MAINPNELDIASLNELPTIAYALDRLLAHSSANGQLGNNTINNLALFIAPYVSAIGASGFVEVTGNVLPNPSTSSGYTILGAGTYTQTGEANVVLTADINIVVWNGTTWALSKAIVLPYVTTSQLSTAIAGIKVIDPNDMGYDILVGLGQSNMVGYTSDYNAVIEYPEGGIDQYATKGANINKIIQASIPLQGGETVTNGGVTVNTVSPLFNFAKWYKTQISPNRKILLVLVAQGSTGFSNNFWGVGKSLYESAITAINAAITAGNSNGGANTRLGAVLWAQGEQDSGMTQAAYAAAFDAQINDFRTRIPNSATKPWVLVGMTPAYDSGPIKAALIDTPNRIYYTAYVQGSTFTDTVYGNIHYSAQGTDANGKKAAYAIPVANSNIAVAPGALTGLTAGTPTGSSIPLSWSATTGALNYKVEFKKSSSGTWITFGSNVTTTSVTVTGLVPNTAYDFRITPHNNVGNGTSATVSASTAVVTYPSAYLKYLANTGITLSGSDVTTWADQGTAGKNAIALTTGNRPVMETVDGVLSVKFVPGKSLVASNQLPMIGTVGSSYTRIAFCRIDALNGTAIQNIFSVNSNAILLDSGATNLKTYHNRAVSITSSDVFLGGGKWYVVIITYDAVSQIQRMFINGVLKATSGTLAPETSSSVVTTVINDFNQLNYGFNQHGVEFHYYDNIAFTTDQIQSFTATKADQYSVTLG